MLLDPEDALRIVALRLGDLLERVAFLGGATTNLLITDPGARAVRLTDDVDLVIEVASALAYRLSLRKKLRDRGFREDTDEGAPICRWVVDGVKVDVMPTDTSVLGFSNRWYASALATAQWLALSDGSLVRIIAAPYFIATKLEAFESRGGGDFQASADLEDIIAVIDGRPTLKAEVEAADPAVRSTLADRIGRWLSDPRFVDALPGHLGGDKASQDRLPELLLKLANLANKFR